MTLFFILKVTTASESQATTLQSALQKVLDQYLNGKSRYVCVFCVYLMLGRTGQQHRRALGQTDL